MTFVLCLTLATGESTAETDGSMKSSTTEDTALSTITTYNSIGTTDDSTETSESSTIQDTTLFTITTYKPETTTNNSNTPSVKRGSFVALLICAYCVFHAQNQILT